jgi:FAD/FMN-containing dehydrogenase
MPGVELNAALSAWAAQLGQDRVLAGPAAQQYYGSDTLGIRKTISAALRPASADAVVTILAIARQDGIPLYPISTGHNWGYGGALPVTDDCVIVDLSGLDRILAFDSELGLATLEPGVTQGALAAYLDRNQLPFLVPVTGGGPQCSLVGNALERGYGITPYADHFAAVTAIEAVMPDGRLYRSALSELGATEADRAYKWGCGPYLDGLFAQGNFGIVTQMTIALARRPERIEAFFFGLRDERRLDDTVLAIRSVLQSLGAVVGSINLMNARRVLAMMRPYPHDRVDENGILASETVAALARENGIMAWMGLGALYGRKDIVRAAVRIVRAELKPHVERLTFMTPERAGFLHRTIKIIPGLRHGQTAKLVATLDRGLQLVAGRPNETALHLAYWKSRQPHPEHGLDPARDRCGLIWYPPLVPMKAARVRTFIAMIEAVCQRHGIEPLITLTSLSDRCFDSSVPILFDGLDDVAASRAQRCYAELLETGRMEGFLPYRLGIHSMAMLDQTGTPFSDLLRRIKAAIDPAGLIAPGRYGAGN